MLETQKPKIAVWLGTHGNELEIADRLEDKHNAAPIPGVLFHRAHPEARGVRYIGRGKEAQQLQNRYPGKIDGDAEQRAAHNNLRWRARYRPTEIYDIHETTAMEYVAVGRRVSPSALAGGIALIGQQDARVFVSSGSFHTYVPNSATLEFSLENDVDMTVDHAYDTLKLLAANSGEQPPPLDAIPSITYYQKLELMSADLQPFLPALEAVPSSSPFSPLHLPDELKHVLQLPTEARLAYETWGHDNMSMKNPDLGPTADGGERADCFGAILIEIAPPIPSKKGFLVFQPEDRMISRKRNGLLRLAS